MKISAKHLRKLILLPMVACCLPFVACSDDDDEVKSTEETVAQLNHVNLIPSQIEGDIELKEDGIMLLEAQDEITLFPVECEKPVDADTEISIKVKPISLDLYNLYHDTNYVLFNDIEILTPKVTIRKGETKSAEMVKIKVTDMSDLYDGLGNHLLPIAINKMPEAFAEGERSELLLNFKKKFYPNAIKASDRLSEIGLSYTEGVLDNLQSNVVINNVILSERTAQDNIDVTLAIDESLISKYNKENGTSYKPFPNASLKETQVQLPMGKNGVGIELLFSDKMASVKYGETYMVPVVIKEVVGGGSLLGKETVAYIRFTANCVFGIEVREDAVGTKITDFGEWDVTVDGKADVSGMPWGYLFYGYDIADIQPGKPLVVDMKEKRTVKSVYWKSYSDYTFTQMTVGVSDDGINYKEKLVHIENPGKVHSFVFVVPTAARYIRLVSTELTHPSRIDIYE